MSGGVDFLHAGKHESFVKMNTMIFDGNGQAFRKSSKEQVCNVSLQYFIKEFRDEIDFFACR